MINVNFLSKSRSTGIEWTEKTWNPGTGCTEVSAGCKNCYAKRKSKRLKAMGNPRYKNGFNLTLHPDKLDEPYRWRKPRLVFVCSMSDPFHPKVPDWFIQKLFKVMNDNRHHTFQVLTKRHERLWEMSPDLYWTRNIWMGVSVENQKVVDRIGYLRDTEAWIKFLSIEPLLGPLPNLNLDGIDWVIVGGESGPKARPMKPEWVKDIRLQCIESGIPFFFKQWGKLANNPDPNDPTAKKDSPHKSKGGCLLDGAIYREMPKTWTEQRA